MEILERERESLGHGCDDVICRRGAIFKPVLSSGLGRTAGCLRPEGLLWARDNDGCAVESSKMDAEKESLGVRNVTRTY